MHKQSVLVLGGSGMLGSMVVDVLSKDQSLSVTATVRSQDLKETLGHYYPKVNWQLLDAESADLQEIKPVINGVDWVINAIGIIKPYIHDDNATETVRALRVNSLFPHWLAQALNDQQRVIQIATDCVYSGKIGNYVEDSPQDPLDVYGKTKSLGEVYHDRVFHLRCSIIGPEPKGKVSLLEWFLGQAKGVAVSGYTNHLWNGVTTYHFARLCQGIMTNNLALKHSQHILPEEKISKADLLKSFAEAYGRWDVQINPTEATTLIDRTLSTLSPDQNQNIWRSAGYAALPTIPQMVAELAKYEWNLKGIDL